MQLRWIYCNNNVKTMVAQEQEHTPCQYSHSVKTIKGYYGKYHFSVPAQAPPNQPANLTDI